MPESIRFHTFPLAGIDAMHARSDRSFPRHTHDTYGVGVIDAGAQSWWSGRGQVCAAAGALICQNPGEVHDGHPVGMRSRAWRMLYLDRAVVDAAAADIGGGAAREFTFAAPTFTDPVVRRRLDAALALCDHAVTPGSTLAAETAVIELVASLRAQAATASRGPSRAIVSIARTRRLIDADPAAPTTLTDLAREAGISRYQLIRAFARESGLTPHAYVLQGRVALARRLLRTNRHVAEVAALSGFYDQSHLTRCFVRYVGITPRRYAMRRG